MDPLSIAQIGLPVASGFLGMFTDSEQEKAARQARYRAKQMLPLELRGAGLQNQMSEAQLRQYQQMSPLELQMVQLRNAELQNEMMRKRSLNPLAQQGMTRIQDILAGRAGPEATLRQAQTDTRKTMPTGSFGF